MAQNTLTQLTEERTHWLARHILPHEAGLRAWLSTRRLPGLEIDDIIQETYMRLITAQDLGGVRNPRAYLFQAAWSVLVTHVRRQSVVQMEALADVNILGMSTDEPSPEDQVADRQELHDLSRAIASLPGKIGEVFRLRRVHGLSQKEVAATLGLAESTVEKHIKRALTLLLDRFTRGGFPVHDASKDEFEGSKPQYGDEERRRSR